MRKKKLLPGMEWVGPRQDDDVPILYFSGYSCEPKAEVSIMERTGLKYRCFSYAFLGEKGETPYPSEPVKMALAWCQQNGTRIFLDSGAFSFHTSKMLAKVTNIDEFIDHYARYVIASKEAGINWDFFVTFDYVKIAAEVWRVTQKLEREYGLRPVPVYHGDASLDWFRKYADAGHKLICVGRIKALGSAELRRYYERVFELAEKLGGIKLHGLMATGANMYRFPWFSVDSATWTHMAAKGRLMYIDRKNKRLGRFQVSRVKIAAAHRALILDRGFSPETMAQSAEERAVYNVGEFMRASHADIAFLELQVRWQPII